MHVMIYFLTSESSDVADSDLDVGSTVLGTLDNEHYLHLAEKQDQAVIYIRHPTNSPIIGLIPH